ncbi:putative fasciclin-like arabinogalactan protein 20 [Ipomoea triloba]|uniref:putative fasciclin-like arabinogalactan protein 20 n=1 Tax=Ipomoea triloba TaxID=35885 RepID=UPI00125CDB0C|nr:putative fasciclin-like arabinogalactan protein 20 [Ipomoea triloba]
MASSKSLSLIIVFLSVVSLSAEKLHWSSQSPSPSPPQFLLNTAEKLSKSGYISMSLTIHLIAGSGIFNAALTSSEVPAGISALTIFSPPDSAFAASGQPSLPHLLLHFAPISLSSTSLHSLPYGSKIPTLSSSDSLYITTSRSAGAPISINGVKLSDESPVFDDGSVTVFEIDDFFPPNFSLPTAGDPSSSLIGYSECKLQPFSQLRDASAALKSRGYMIMASFLDLQLFGFLNPSPLKLTVFAPVDAALISYSRNAAAYQSLLLRHILPCVLPWTELNELGKGAGTVFKDYVSGFTVAVTSSNRLIFVNGVRITFPDMYHSDTIVIHGVREMIPFSDDTESGRAESVNRKIQEFMSQIVVNSEF